MAKVLTGIPIQKTFRVFTLQMWRLSEQLHCANVLTGFLIHLPALSTPPSWVFAKEWRKNKLCWSYFPQFLYLLQTSIPQKFVKIIQCLGSRKICTQLVPSSVDNNGLDKLELQQTINSSPSTKHFQIYNVMDYIL